MSRAPSPSTRATASPAERRLRPSTTSCRAAAPVTDFRRGPGGAAGQLTERHPEGRVSEKYSACIARLISRRSTTPDDISPHRGAETIGIGAIRLGCPTQVTVKPIPLIYLTIGRQSVNPELIRPRRDCRNL